MAGARPRRDNTLLATVKEACAANIGSLRLVFSDDAKEAVPFVSDSSGEKDSARLREKIPQTIKLERCAIGAHKRLDKIARNRIVIIDQSIPEIADPKFVALHQSKSPRRVEIPA